MLGSRACALCKQCEVKASPCVKCEDVPFSEGMLTPSQADLCMTVDLALPKICFLLNNYMWKLSIYAEFFAMVVLEKRIYPVCSGNRIYNTFL